MYLLRVMATSGIRRLAFFSFCVPLVLLYFVKVVVELMMARRGWFAALVVGLVTCCSYANAFADTFVVRLISFDLLSFLYYFFIFIYLLLLLFLLFLLLFILLFLLYIFLHYFVAIEKKKKKGKGFFSFLSFTI